MSVRRWIEDDAIYYGIAGESDELSFVFVVGMLVHIDEQVVARRIDAFERVIKIGSCSLCWSRSAVPFPQHNCFACTDRLKVIVIIWKIEFY